MTTRRRRSHASKSAAPVSAPRSVLDDIFLRALVRDIVRGSVAASLTVAAAGCDSFPTIDESFIEPTCRDGEWDGLSGIEPGQPVDAIAWRTVRPPGTVEDIALAGEPCSGATDTDACDVEWAEAGVEDEDIGERTSGQSGTSRNYLVVERGDAVTTAGTRAEVVDLLGAINTEDEAMLLARWDHYQLRCGNRELSSASATDDGFLVVGTRLTKSCAPTEETRYLLQVAQDGSLEVLDSEVYSSSQVCAGRKPSGLCSRVAHHAGILGDHFAQAAHLEAASVIAFEVLAEELVAHDAPVELIALARHFARDEARHTEQVTALARRFGGNVKTPIVRRQPVRSLEAIALENAVEGCVRETYGALLGAYQAEVASDPAIKTCMRSIAYDEAQHASLSHALDAWLMPRLNAEARERIAAAKCEAFSALRASAAQPSEELLHEVAGVPRPAAALRLLDALAEQLA